LGLRTYNDIEKFHEFETRKEDKKNNEKNTGSGIGSKIERYLRRNNKFEYDDLYGVITSTTGNNTNNIKKSEGDNKALTSNQKLIANRGKIMRIKVKPSSTKKKNRNKRLSRKCKSHFYYNLIFISKVKEFTKNIRLEHQCKNYSYSKIEIDQIYNLSFLINHIFT